MSSIHYEANDFGYSLDSLISCNKCVFHILREAGAERIVHMSDSTLFQHFPWPTHKQGHQLPP